MKLAPLLFRLLLPLLALAASSTSSAHRQADASEEADVRSVSSFKAAAMVSAYACTLHDTIIVEIHLNRSTSLSNCVSLLHLILSCLLSCPLHYTLQKILRNCFMHFYDCFFVNQELRRLREAHRYDETIAQGLQGKCQCKHGSS
jgi:hypothetical protein